MIQSNSQIVNCACVIHGDAYNWTYVERLQSMLTKNFSIPIQLHVFTEESRTVPNSMIRHNLIPWPGIAGPKKAWWYKIQMFDPQNYSGQLLYFDLDVVITGNLDWILTLHSHYFWSIRDFKYLWRPTWQGINSSVMYWDTARYSSLWNKFNQETLTSVTKKYKGDQDFLTEHIQDLEKKFFDQDAVQSWRWQAWNGGYDIKTRSYRRPGAGTAVPPSTKILVFHGNPKPHEITDPVVASYWK